MKIGIIGLPQVGKKTLFELLTGEKVTEQVYSAKADYKIGAARIRDERFDKLVKLYQPKKSTPATIDVILFPKFDKEIFSKAEFVRSLETCDAVCHIVRAFNDDSVFHVNGNVDALRDIETVYAEFILNDLILIEKRIERISKELMNKSNPTQVKEKELLLKMKEVLDKNLPLISLEISDADKKVMTNYQFITAKPMIVVLNVNEVALNNRSLIDKVKEKDGINRVKVMQISAKIEAELSLLEEKDKEEFLKELGIKNSALNQMGCIYYETLGLISFFTVGKNEVRAWITKKSSSAPEAAGVVHSDMQRGFIRAEIMKCDDLFHFGCEAKLKDAGKMQLRGKDYILEDGDIMRVRFNV